MFKNHKKLTIALICLGVVLIGLGAFLMTRLMRPPIKKVVDAGWNSYYALEDSAFGQFAQNIINHGSLSLRADVSQMQDLISSLLPLPLKLEATAEISLFNNDGSHALKAEAAVKGKTLLDALVLYNEGKDLALSSDALFGKTNYGLSLKNFGKNLENSPFNPAKKGKYALPEDLFKRLRDLQFEEGGFKKLKTEGRDRLKALLSHAGEYLNDHAKFRSGSANVTVGKSFSAQSVTMEFDEKVLCSFLEEMLRYGREDKELQAYLLRLLDKLGFVFGPESPEVLRGKLNDQLKKWAEQIPSLREKWEGTQFSAQFFIHQNNLIRIEAKAIKGEKEAFLGLSLGPDPKAFDVISLEYRNPDHTVLAMDYTVSARSADLYSARLEVRRDASVTHDLSLNWMKDSGKFSAVLQRLNPDKSSWGSASLSANIKQKDKVTELQLEKLSIVEGSSLQDVSLKGVSLLFNEAAQFPALANFTEITSMSEEQIETVFEDVQETFQGLLGGLLGGLFSSFGTK